MKKVLFAAILAASSTMAMADNDTGCGLGTQVMAGKSGLVFKVLAVTTNGTSGNQTFGMTFNTLGCSADGVIKAEARLGEFMGGNADALARDVSLGHGESLNVLADLIGVQAQDKATFFKTAKANFGTIYAASNRTTGDVLASLKTVMSHDAILSAYVVAA